MRKVYIHLVATADGKYFAICRDTYGEVFRSEVCRAQHSALRFAREWVTDTFGPSIRIEVERMAQEVYDRTASPFFVRETKENANASAGASRAAYPANTDGGATC